MIRFLISVFIFIPSICFASENSNYLAYTLKAFGSLLIVLALMFFAMYFLKRLNIASRFKSSRINILDRLYIDNKRSIVIARIDDKEFALGVGENINVITQVKNDENKDSV